jgi:hypothetical protein
MIAEQKTPGDPQVTDWGALVAAVSRHEAEIFGIPVYDSPHARAAALLQLLLHVPALERSNAMFASAVAYAYLVASGLKVVTSPEQVRGGRLALPSTQYDVGSRGPFSGMNSRR